MYECGWLHVDCVALLTAVVGPSPLELGPGVGW